MSRYASLFGGAAAQDPSADTAPAQRYRILIVDDDALVLRALQRVFQEENYEITLAADGQAALQKLRAAPFHLIISDYAMPGMTGAQLLEQVKALQPDTIRIMLTGQADTAAVMGAINNGAVYKFILKPWNDDDLRVTVALALERFDLGQKNRKLETDNARKTQEIQALSKLAVSNRSQLAITLHKRELLNNKQVQELYRLQQARREPVIKLLLERDWVPEQTIRKILCQDLLIDEVALDEFQVGEEVAALLPQSFCARQGVVPLKVTGRRLLLAMADPLDSGLLEDLRFASGLEIQAAYAPLNAINDKIAAVYGTLADSSFREIEALMASGDPFEGIEIVIDDDGDQPLEELLRDTQEPPAIRLVNAIILEAIRHQASDIHIQPRTKSVVVRYRIDGVLSDKIQIPHQMHQGLVSRLKVMSELDISERRRPQDGRITVKSPLRVIDLRISTLPTINGEKVVMRILDRNASILRMDSLGMPDTLLPRVLRMIDKPQGIILATGPTGSGKTSTLYALLQHNATPDKNYVTIEDPVEYYMDMAGQVMIKEKIGLTFPVVLRSILRQDPDVVLLGEIRDLETAEVAFHAALTGHLVYSTLHTNSAIATLSRLLDLGLKPYVVATALEGIIAQRLVRKICEHCRVPDTPTPVMREYLGAAAGQLQTPFRGSGCKQCNNTGYKGRVGIYEVLFVEDALRAMISSGAGIMDITRWAQENGTLRLIDDAIDKINLGLTTVEEVLRVLGPQ